MIATDAKHTKVDQPGNVRIETFVSAMPEANHDRVELRYEGTPKVKMGSLVWGSSDVLHNAYEVYKDLVYGLRVR